jgi:hypothetical protein
VSLCKNCNQELISKSSSALYCSNKCKTAAHRLKNKSNHPSICWFCLAEFKIKGRTKFCCEDHKNKFHKRKEMNKPIILSIDPKTKIETRKYDKILEVYRRWREIRKDFIDSN